MSRLPGLPSKTLWVVPLVCDPAQAHYADWSALGEVHLRHQAIAPGGSYSVQSILAGCGITAAANYSIALPLPTAVWGDVVSNVQECPRGPANGTISVVADVVSLINKFANLPCAPSKSRADLEPRLTDLKVGISDVLRSIGAFRGESYPFTPSATPCS